MNQTVDIHRASQYAPGKLGGQLPTFGVLLEDVPCMIQALSASERAILGSEGVEITHRMFCELQSETLTEKDRVVAGSTIYEINLVDDVAGMNHHLELLLTEIRDGGRS